MSQYEFEQRLSEMQRLLEEKEEQIARLSLEAQGAAHAVQSAQAEATNATHLAQQREQLIAQLERQAQHNGSTNPFLPAESVLKNLQTPQIIRDLPCFDGNTVKLHQFLRAIDNLIPIIETARASPIYNVWMQSIRSKVIGDADTVLELYGTELTWSSIKTNLLTHYNDKRDEVSLTRDLFKLNQIGSVEEFYGKVSHIISLLINKLNLNEINGAVKAAKQKFYQEMGLKVFVAGLKEPLGPIIRAQAPDTLKEALTLCLEESNYNYVRNPFKPSAPSLPPKLPYKPSVPDNAFRFMPPRRPPPPGPPYKRPFQHTNPFANPNPFKQNSFHQKQNPFTPNTFNKSPFTPNPFQQTNAFVPRPIQMPKPVPMEVDRSLRSQRLNYMNRPRAHHQVNWHEGTYSGYYPEYYLDEDGREMNYDDYVHPEQYHEEVLQEENNIAANVPPIAEQAQPNSPPENEIIDDLNFQVATNLGTGT